MKSKTSFFNRGLARSLLRRFWPLWTTYFGILLLMLPVSLSNKADSFLAVGASQPDFWDWLRMEMDVAAVNAGIVTAFLSAFVGVVAAMAMFHYLYQSRSCGMINSLPLKRETVFGTAWLTGLAPLLLADLLVMLLTALFFCTRGYMHFRALLEFFALAAMGNVAFYGFAVFCAMLTGNLLVLPAVYAVLSFTAAVAESASRNLLSTFVFGMGNGGLSLGFLSPPVQLIKSLGTRYLEESNSYELSGLGVLAAYCAAGLLLSFAALLLYKRRRMETAGDVVAIRVLKPVFKYCLCFGTALVFADLVLNTFFNGEARGLAAAGIVLGLMLLGGFIGYFAAEMLVQKTLKVFSGKWRGFAVACAVIALFVGVFEFDLAGVEKRVPAPEDAELVSLSGMGEIAELSDPALLAEAADFHRAVIADKAACEADGDVYVFLTWLLKDGRTISRQYSLPGTDAGEAGSLARRAEALLNAPEAVLERVTPEIEVEHGTVFYASVDFGHWYTDYQGERDFGWTGWELTASDAVSLYREGILPDAEAGQIGLAHLVRDESYYESAYPVTIHITLRDMSRENFVVDTVSVDVEAASENTLRWLRQHTEVPLWTYAELGVTG